MKLQQTDSYAKAYVEILEIINHMGEEYKKKIPSKLLDFFEDNKDLNYIYDLDEANSNEIQIFSNETIGLLSMLELKYWTTENEKELLNNALIENEKKYQKALREKYNPNEIFKNNAKKITKEETTSNLPIEVKKDNFLKRIIDYIKSFFI